MHYIRRMEKKTTIQIDTDRINKFRDAAKSEGFDWRHRLNHIIDSFIKECKQSKVKSITGKAKGAL